MGSLVIAVYRPKKGKSKALLELVRTHVPTLRELGLVTARPPIVGKAGDGSIVEIFEWTSPEAIDQAHHDKTVQRLWKRFNAVSEYVALDALAESSHPFPALEPIDMPSQPGSIDWIDMTVPDAPAGATKVRRFYEKVVGLGVMPVPMGAYEDFCMIAGDGRVTSGICHGRGANADVPGGWLPYMTVASLAKSLAAARKAGGTVVGKPRSAGGGKFAIVRDPGGAHVGLFEYPKKRK